MPNGVERGIGVRIAIDGQFRSLPPSGIGAYLEALVRELPIVAPELKIDVIERPDAMGSAILPDKLRNDARLQRFHWETLGFAAAAKAHRPDLLHIPSFAAPLKTSIPFVVTIHDAIPFVLPEYQASAPMRAHLALMKRTTKRAVLVLTPSEAAADDLHRILNVPRHRIRVTPEAAGEGFRTALTRDLDPAVAQRLGISGPFIFNVGGLDVRKRVDLLIEAFAAALADLPSDMLLVIGGKAHSGNPVVFPDLGPMIDRLGVRDRVILTGWLSDAEKIALYQSATIYATPSIYEGFGLTPLEAMACGAPVIASNRTSLPEVVGDAGLLLGSEVEEWKNALVKLANDAMVRSNLSARGIERAAEFTWKRAAGQTIEAYQDAIELSKRG